MLAQLGPLFTQIGQKRLGRLANIWPSRIWRPAHGNYSESAPKIIPGAVLEWFRNFCAVAPNEHLEDLFATPAARPGRICQQMLRPSKLSALACFGDLGALPRDRRRNGPAPTPRS